MWPLRFPDPRSEHLFRVFDERHAEPGVRRLAAAAMAIVLVTIFLDAWQPTPVQPLVVVLRGVMLATSIALLVSTYWSGGAGRWSSRLAWAAAVFGVSEAALLTVDAPPYRSLHQLATPLILALSLSGLRLRFAHAVALAACLDAALTTSIVVSGAPPWELGLELTLLLAASAIGLLIAYERDGNRRRHFLEFLAHQHHSSRLRQLSEQLHKLSLSDELTGLPNGRELQARLGEALAASERHRTSAVVARIDLDRFQEVNDRLGPAAADSLLRRVAAILGRSMRAGDTVCRMGADEFCVLMPGTSLQEGMRRIDGALLRLRRATGSTGREVSFSAGCAESRPGERASALLRRADAALVRAKAAGRGRVHGSQSTRALDQVAVAS